MPWAEHGVKILGYDCKQDGGSNSFDNFSFISELQDDDDDNQILEFCDSSLSVEIVVINPLTPELPQHGVPRPRAPRHNIIRNSYFRNFQPDISSLRE